MGKAMSDAELAKRVSEILPKLGSGPVAGWDLDSTVRDTSHRRHVAHAMQAAKTGQYLVNPDTNHPYTWDDYYMLCGDDTPIEGSVVLARELALLGYTHVAISGSSELALALTHDWLQDNAVPIFIVMLRKDGDHTPNGTWKVRVLREMQRQGVDVRLFFEDWGKVAEQVKQETGIPVVGINPFDSEEMSSLGKGL